MAELFLKFLDRKITICILFIYMAILVISTTGGKIETSNLCIPKEESVFITHCKPKGIFKFSHLVNPDEIPALKNKFENIQHSYSITKSEAYLLKDEFLKKRKHRNTTVIEIKQVDDFNSVCKISWLETCNQNSSVLEKACITSGGSTIERCENIPYSKNPLSICIQGPEKEIVTCEGNTYQTLCFVSEYDYLHLHPCRKPHLQACIGTGVLDICPNTVTPIKVATENQSNNMQQTRNQSLKNHRLCKSKSTGKFRKCSMNSTDFICLQNEKSNLGYCQMFTNIFEDRRQVCVEDSSNILFICEKHDQKRICISETNNDTYKTCNSNNQVACLYAEKIQNCYSTLLLNQTKDLENTRKMRKQSKPLYKISPWFLVPDLDNTTFGRRIKRNSNSSKHADNEGFSAKSYSEWLNNKNTYGELCINKSNQNTFYICKNDSAVNKACLGIVTKKIKICEDGLNVNLIAPIFNVSLTFPICVKGNKKEVIICGVLFHFNVCAKNGSKLETFESCFNEKRYTCLNEEGKMEFCDNLNGSKKNDSQENIVFNLNGSSNDDNKENDNSEQYESYEPDKDTNTHKKEKGKKKSQEQSNSDKDEDQTKGDDLEAKKKILKRISKMHNNSILLCKTSSKGENYIHCNKDKELNFACYGSKTYMIKECDAFKKSGEKSLYLCAEKSTSYLVTCENGRNKNLCFSDSSSKKLQPCKKEDSFACLREKGVIRSCTQSMSPISLGSVDEKFLRLHCENCSIENQLIIDGESKEILPDADTIYFDKS